MRRVVFSAVLLAAATLAPAQETRQDTIYRCTDALGALTIQNGTPCPKGSRQEVQVVESPMVIPRFEAPPPVVTAAPEPEPVPAPAEPERPQAPPPAKLADAQRLPPPPLYQCSTWDNDRYLSEDPEPKPRCVALQTTGLAGDPNRAGGQACEMKYDLCARVPDGAACEGWKQRQREIESTWRYAPGADKPRLQDEFARVTKILNDTTCGAP
ncbi:hypothetical protein [Luteimonas mephitis]|uniref:hypothetical protein n=1 Tax=Luteimonas mephitis TaxID=83615 RepID=UPI00040F7E01|nr:hypothetical protein [Luteimonas mephitis]